MLVSDSARIVVATNDEYKQKPWLGLNFWGKPEVHPPLERVTMKLSYHDGRSTGDMWYSIFLPENKPPYIKIGGTMSTSSIVGYRNLRVQKLDASALDLDFTNTLLDTN